MTIKVEGKVRYEHEPETETLRIHIPIRFAKRGGLTRIVLPEGYESSLDRPHPAPTLRNALVTAWEWLEQLESGKAKSLKALCSKQGKTSKGEASRILKLTCLAPDIQEAILTGEGLGLLQREDFMQPFSLLWEEQRQQFKLSKPAK